MPTSIWGVAFYVFALFPGVAFVFAREGHRAVGKRSALRETATVVFVSAICDAIVALGVIVFAAFQPIVQSTISTTLSGDLSWIRQYFGLATVYSILTLGAATTLGFFLGSKWVHDHGLKAIWKSAIPRDVSAWQQVLLPEQKVEVRVGLSLKSGAWISGTLWDFDNDPDGDPHRTITLSGQIQVRAQGAGSIEALDDTDWVVVEAGDIELLQASYYTVNANVEEVPTRRTPRRARRLLQAATLFAGVTFVLSVLSALGIDEGDWAKPAILACLGASALLTVLWLFFRRAPRALGRNG